jgi:hypothetical protein
MSFREQVDCGITFNSGLDVLSTIRAIEVGSGLSQAIHHTLPVRSDEFTSAKAGALKPVSVIACFKS